MCLVKWLCLELDCIILKILRNEHLSMGITASICWKAGWLEMNSLFIQIIIATGRGDYFEGETI